MRLAIENFDMLEGCVDGGCGFRDGWGGGLIVRVLL